MLGFGHQTFFNLCLALFTLAAISVVCLGLLLIERQNYDLLQQNVTSLRAENNRLKSELRRFQDGPETPDATISRPDE
jgi:hypothetical protein